MTEDWEALARAVRGRREQQAMPLDLRARGGPSEMTMRKIESGEPVSVKAYTKDRLERALGVREGAIDRTLTGAATPEEWTVVALRSGRPELPRPGDVLAHEILLTALQQLTRVPEKTGPVKSAMKLVNQALNEVLAEVFD